MTLHKIQPIRSTKMRESARGEDCTLQIPGVCNGNPETTVLCHLPDESKGMGRKSDDICAAYGCSDCHDAIDGRGKFEVVGEFLEDKSTGVITGLWCDREWYLRRAMVRTLRRMIEKGLIKIA
jgi:hypothetical protein